MNWRVVVGVLLIGCGSDGESMPHDGAIDSGSGGDAILVATDPAGNPTTSLDFGAALVGQSSTAKLVVANSGTGTSGPIALAIAGTHANDFAFDDQLTTCAGLALEAGASCNVVLVFRPTASGTRLGSLTISTQSGGTTTIALAGQAAVPDLHFVPTSFTFAPVEIGQTAYTSLELRNDGADTVSIDGLVVSGTSFLRGLSTCGASLAPASSCDITVSVTPQTLGTAQGSLVVTSDGLDFVAMLSAPAVHRVSISRSGNGTGTITSSPAGIACGSACTALFVGDVVLTAAAGPGSALTGWSVPACGTGSTCIVPAEVDPVTVVASFALTGSGQLDVTFAGDAPGELQVTDDYTGEILATCFASCSVPVDPGDRIEIQAVTPSTFGGFAGACTGTSVPCKFTATAGLNSVTAAFNKDPHERWTRLLPGDQLQSVGYDSAGNLLVGSGTRLIKLSPTGSTLWTQTRSAAVFAIGPGDTIYIHAGTALVKLASDGSELWTRPTDTNTNTCARSHIQALRCIAVGADGAVAIHGTGVGRWDAAGTPTWSKPVSFGTNGIGIDLQGVVVVAVESLETMSALRFAAADGAALSPLQDVTPSYRGMLSIDPGGRLLTCSALRDYVHYSVEGITSGSIENEGLGEVQTAIVSNATGQVGLGYTHDSGWSAMGPDWGVTRYLNLDYGSGFLDLAISPAGKVALIGWYHSLTFDGNWIQTFDP